MFCKDFAENLALYADESLAERERVALGAHLDKCPVCRAKFAEIQALRTDLKTFSRPAPPADLLGAVRGAVSAELKQARAQSIPVFSADLREWLWMRVMPYGVGAAASLLLSFAFLSSLVSSRSAAIDVRDRAAQSKQPAIVFNNDFSFGGGDPFLTQADFAALRLPVSNESPSLNPSGALIALTKSVARGGEMTDEEVVVVADVFGDGIARIAEVVKPPRNRQSLKDLEKALENDPAFAPFVPASVDQRPQNVRVVLKIQRVEVATDLGKPGITRN